jgi:ribose/xylose/arabinose/galactoside ABC-type transport system permease subunit
VGLVGIVVGILMLHNTDGVASNALWGTISLVGALLAATGYASVRFETMAPHGPWWVPASSRQLFAGLAATVVAFVLTRFLDKDQERVLLSIPSHPVKVLIGVLAFAGGASLVAWRGITRMRQHVGVVRRSAWAYPKLVFTSLVGGLAMLVGVLTFLQLCTEQGFRSLVQVGLGGVGILLILGAKGVATRVSSRAQLLIGAVAAAVILFTGFVVRHDAGSNRFRSGYLAVMAILATLVLGNALLEYMFQKRRAPDAKADRMGRILAFTGIGVALFGVAIRLIWSGAPVRVSILWWLLVTMIGAYVLAKTRWGNWIFAVGGNKEAARAVGVPVDKVKIGLFMMVSLVGCLVGMMTALRYTSVAASQGVGEEFEYIIAAVVGGCLLTGGYGSVIGAAFGAMISAMLATGIPGSRWNTDNKYIFLGAVLFLAVLVNQKVRKKAQEAR